ncbi:acyltransferase family protein [Prevotella sp.]|uniref:acyltransferase family protein n=1 Tax=Prevotella sp. TaxID=59823 RepID=UPI002F93E5D8
MQSETSTVFADSKPHYQLLDGLRGVAALLVLWYHVNEGYGFAGYVNGVSDGSITHFNHGYLAVDFFFILSGFVIGYAYDDRWRQGFTNKEFFRRRLIRLHPMVVLGAVIGLATFLLQGGVKWDGTSVPLSLTMLALLCAMFMIPAFPGSSYDVRGNAEMFSLNGPAWSLFFEYIGNILYALLLHRLSTKMLGVLTAILGALLAWFTMGDVAGTGSFGVGWTLDGLNFWGGMLRMMFPYTMGMFLSRIFKPVKVRGAFWICSLVMVLLFAVPYINGTQPFCWNGLFEAACIILVFPVLVWLGASGTTTDDRSTRICRFLGDISFPLYIIHYPFMYLFYAWMIRHEAYNFASCPWLSMGVMAGNIVLAYLCLKFFDLPIRQWLNRKTAGK